LKPNNSKSLLSWALVAIIIGYLFFVWVPKQRNKNIDAQKVLRDAQTALDNVRVKLDAIQSQNLDATTKSKSAENTPIETK
jgi:uncharacterized membrane-anchored protein YhcB (DUF1043 family)